LNDFRDKSGIDFSEIRFDGGRREMEGVIYAMEIIS
jgi:hypothetical protein